MQDDDAAPDDELEAVVAEYIESASKSIRRQTDIPAKIIETVRELLAADPLGNEGPGPGQDTELQELQRWFAIAERIEQPTRQGHMQALSMLAALVRQLSVESGRPEAEILEQLGEGPRKARDEGLFLIQQVATALHPRRVPPTQDP